MWGASRRVGAARARYLANIVRTGGQYNYLLSAVLGGPCGSAAAMAL